MSKKYLLIGGVLVLALAAILVVAAQPKNDEHNHHTDTASSSQQTTNPNEPNTEPAERPITITGTIGCLAHKPTGDPQTMECAIGIQADDGKSYALNGQDPTTTGMIPTGTKVEVSGTLTQPSSKYDIAGTINVNNIKEL